MDPTADRGLGLAEALWLDIDEIRQYRHGHQAFCLSSATTYLAAAEVRLEVTSGRFQGQAGVRGGRGQTRLTKIARRLPLLRAERPDG